MTEDKQHQLDELTNKQFANLEKENTELKEEMEAKQVVLNDFKNRVETVTDRFNKKSLRLTKSKEIMTELLSVAKFYNKYSKGAVIDITPIHKAEQFLEEEQNG